MKPASSESFHFATLLMVSKWTSDWPGPSMFESLLQRIAIACERAGLPYMIIGGQAVLRYGEPRLTKDIDVSLGLDLDRLPEAQALVDGLGLTPLVDPQVFTRQTLVLPCLEPETGIRVDLILAFSPYEQEALLRARPAKLGTAEVRFASPEDLIVHKIIAARPRDLDDVRSVLARNPGLDFQYIRQWLREFAQALDQPVLERFDAIATEGR
ncbi:MAG TPA: nucleotidyl transferase AbiEii/AbiGii toxin family protein [Candidatus Sulfotelmatobacter sp.]|nr:nucleotidyl transferase AbiEii/AbiGii toxin family protein [Candidatus Sulfotelmatobacter sp.]